MTAEAIGLPIAIIVLLFAFGTVVASFVPLIIGIVTVVYLVRRIDDSRWTNGSYPFSS